MNKIDYFLSYNKDNIFKNLIQAEHHAKLVKDTNHAQCIVKHLAFIEGEIEEAINHSQQVEPGKTQQFKEFREEVYNLRKKVMSGKFSPDELNKNLWELRKKFESFNPEYDISKCNACGSSEEIVEKLVGDKYLSRENRILNSEMVMEVKEGVKLVAGSALGILTDRYLPVRYYAFGVDLARLGLGIVELGVAVTQEGKFTGLARDLLHVIGISGAFLIANEILKLSVAVPVAPRVVAVPPVPVAVAPAVRFA